MQPFDNPPAALTNQLRAHSERRETRLIIKPKPYKGYWIAAALMITFGLWTLQGQWTQDINPSADYGYGSYRGFLSGMWRGDDGLYLGVDDLPRSAYLISDFLHPYLLIAIGLWLCDRGKRRRNVAGNQSSPESRGSSPPKSTWPPPPNIPAA